MVTIAGKVKYSGAPVDGAKVQVLVLDEPNNIRHWTNVVTVDNGRYQVTFSDVRDWHQNFSESAIIVVSAWIGEDRLSNHNQLGSSIIQYDGDSLVFGDVEIFDASDCSFVLKNQNISVVQEERIQLKPIIESTNQVYMVRDEVVFPQTKPASIRYSINGSEYTTNDTIVFYDVGINTVDISMTTVNGLTQEFTMNVTVSEKSTSQTYEFKSFDIERETVFFSVRGRGIKDNNLQLSVFSSPNFSISSIEIEVDGSQVYADSNFSNPIVNAVIPTSLSVTSEVRLIAHGENTTTHEQITREYTATVKRFSTILGDISVSYNAADGKHTAALNIQNPSEVSEILWQITFDSPIIQRVIQPDNDTDRTALIHVLYQKYTDPSDTQITFQAMHGGSYKVVAYLINNAGAYFKVEEPFIVPGGADDSEELKVGDTILIACKSNHGEVPILKINRLSRDGFADIGIYPMEHAYDRMYTYQHTIDNPDSFYIFKAGTSLVVKKVGTPRGCLIAYSKKMESGKTINYELKDFNGNVADSGVMSDSGYGLYYHILPENAHGIVTVGNNSKVI